MMAGVSTADQQRAWRASQGARTGQPGRPVAKPCGTTAAYRRHQRAGEDPCGPCREEWRVHQAKMYEQRKNRAKGAT